MNPNRILCACGCGKTRWKRNRGSGHLGKYVHGHHMRMPKFRRAARASGLRVAGWNRGKTYVMGKREVYANRGAWNAAARRMFGDRCMICGWNAGPCDTHHVIPAARGGRLSLDNAAVLCPNHHRLVHVGTISEKHLARARAKAPKRCSVR